MAFVDRKPGRHRTATIAAVAGLHGMALYGLITGLGVDYIATQVTTLTGRNIPLDPPPPPPPEALPEAKPKAEPVRETVTLRPPIDLPREPAPLPIRPADYTPPSVAPPLDPPTPYAKPLPALSEVAARPARPRNDPGAWATTDDYPVGALRRREEGVVRFELALDAAGRVSACRVTVSSGSADLDTATCRQVTRRARFQPATDTRGERVASTFAGSIRWVIPKD